MNETKYKIIDFGDCTISPKKVYNYNGIQIQIDKTHKVSSMYALVIPSGTSIS